MTDISVEVGGFTLNVRVAAILRRQGALLLNRLKGSDFWFLPGGRVKAGETSQQAMARELREELQRDFAIGPFAFMCENFFTHETKRFHEICFFFEVSDDAGLDAEGLEDDRTVYAWVPETALKELDLRPAFLKTMLPNPSPGQKHMVVK